MSRPRRGKRKRSRKHGVSVNKLRHGAFVKSRLQRSSRTKMRKYRERIAIYIASEGHSYDEVLKWGFQQLMQELIGPDYMPMSRMTLTRDIDSLADKARIVIGNHLQRNRFVVTADIATVIHTTTGYLVMTAHYIDPATPEVITSVTLGARQLSGSHTSDEIFASFLKILKDFGLKEKDLKGGVTDGAPNIVKAMKQLVGADKHIVCVNHTLHNIVTKVQKACNIIMMSFEKLNKLISHFRQSTLSMDRLRASQEEDGRRPSNMLKLKKYIKPRWNSQLISACSFLKLKKHVDNALAESTSDVQNLNSTETHLLEEYSKLTAPLFEVTSILSGESYPTVNLVIPCLKFVLTKLENAQIQSGEAKQMQNMLREEIHELLNKYMQNVLFTSASYLDPRYKSEHLSIVSNSLAVDSINKKLESLRAANSSDDSFMKGSIFYPYYLEKIKEKLRAWSSSYDRELIHYINCEMEEFDCNVLRYWVDRASGYSPILSNIAIQSLLIPATSTAFERAVSALNLIAVKKRSRLSAKHVDNLVLLKCLDSEKWVEISK